MQEFSRKVLAFQRTPIVLLVANAGSVPESFLDSLREYEKEYVLSRSDSEMLAVTDDLLEVIGAARIYPAVSSLLVDSLVEPPLVSDTVDSYFLALAGDEHTTRWLSQEVAVEFRKDVRDLLVKTRQRFGVAHLVVIDVLDRFVNGRLVTEEVVVEGEVDIAGSVANDELLSFDAGVLDSLSDDWSVVGVNAKFFSSDSLRKQLVEKLSSMRVALLSSVKKE